MIVVVIVLRCRVSFPDNGYSHRIVSARPPFYTVVLILGGHLDIFFPRTVSATNTLIFLDSRHLKRRNPRLRGSTFLHIFPFLKPCRVAWSSRMFLPAAGIADGSRRGTKGDGVWVICVIDVRFYFIRGSGRYTILTSSFIFILITIIIIIIYTEHA